METEKGTELEYEEWFSNNDTKERAEEQKFMIDDDQKADWAIRKIAEEKEECERIQALAEAEIRKIEEKVKEAEKRFQNATANLTSLLASYFRMVKHKETKTMQTYRLLSGRLVLKKSKSKPVYEDSDLLKFLKENALDSYIKTEEKPKWGEFSKQLDVINGKAVVKDTGEIVDCIKIEQTPEVFLVEV